MNYEKDVFKKKIPDYDKLLKYGFKFKDGKYEYTRNIFNNQFKVIISIEDNLVYGKLYDLDINEEYTNFRVETQNGSFVSKVREEYVNLLLNIADNCFTSKPFISNQANRINNLIFKKYGDEAIFKFEEYPDFGIFENNNKWYALIMNVSKSKLGFKDNSEVEIINLKLDKNKIISLLKENGFYKAYHMNKNSWISILLDDSISDDYIMNLVDESHSYTVISKTSSNEWVMPINPNYFDVFHYFDSADIYYWDNRKSFKKGDIIYLYITKPVGEIMYKCLIDDITDDFTIVRKIYKYEDGKYSLAFLKKHGLTSIRSVRHIPEALSREINKK